MKKIILSTCLLIASSGLFAQLNKGAFTVTGTLGFNGSKNMTTQTNLGNSTTTTTNDQKSSGMTVVPAVGYFFTNQIEAGLALAMIKSTTTNEFSPPSGNPFATKTQKNENPLTAFGLFANYYLINAARYACYAGLQFGLGSGTGKVTTTLVNGNSTVVETKNNGNTFGLNGGFLYFVRDNLALNANLGLLSFNTIKSESTSNNFTTESKNSSWTFGVNGVIINIGVKLILGNNKSDTPAASPAS